MKRKSVVKTHLTEKYRGHIVLSDILGKLEEDEIPIAKENGLLFFDLWRKANRLNIPPIEWFDQGFTHIAPVFDGYGNPKRKFDPLTGKPIKAKYLIPDYEALKKALTGEKPESIVHRNKRGPDAIVLNENL